jgi:signal transduction histidine kinase
MVDRLRGQTALVVAAGVLLEAAAMAAMSPRLLEAPSGAPGAVGVSIAVVAALAAGPLAGVVVAGAGWAAFFLLVAETDTTSLVVFPIWLGAAALCGAVAKALVGAERELAARATERKELQRLDRAKSEFIEFASHELRSPATVVAGIASTLHLRGDRLSSAQRIELRRTLFEQAERLRTLIDQLLDLSRLDSDAIKIERRPFLVRRQLEEILLVSTDRRARDVVVEVPPELEVIADPDAFDRVVSNLIANAFRYGAPPVSITAEQRDRHFRLAVEDRGDGVPAEFVPRLFERFARDDRTSRDTEGSGLGLAIAQSYAQAHGGEVLYEKASPHGAKFELVLPVDRS